MSQHFTQGELAKLVRDAHDAESQISEALHAARDVKFSQALGVVGCGAVNEAVASLETAHAAAGAQFKSFRAQYDAEQRRQNEEREAAEAARRTPQWQSHPDSFARNQTDEARDAAKRAASGMRQTDGAPPDVTETLVQALVDVGIPREVAGVLIEKGKELGQRLSERRDDS